MKENMIFVMFVIYLKCVPVCVYVSVSACSFLYPALCVGHL